MKKTANSRLADLYTKPQSSSPSQTDETLDPDELEIISVEKVKFTFSCQYFGQFSCLFCTTIRCTTYFQYFAPFPSILCATLLVYVAPLTFNILRYFIQYFAPLYLVILRHFPLLFCTIFL